MMKKRIIVLLCLLLACATIFGCQTNKEQPSTPSPVQSQEQSQEAAKQEETPSAKTQTNEFTDMAGRVVELPEQITKVYGTDPVASITLYTLAPEKLLGWNYELNKQEREYIMSEYADLPVYGMRDSFNLEAVIADAPQLVLHMGSLKEDAVAQAEELQKTLNIPVVMLSGKMSDIPQAYTMLGQILGEETRAKELADYAQAALQRAISIQIPEEEKVTVYYGNGVDSLETAPKGSDAAEVIEMAGGINVADLEVEDVTERITVSKEQIISWNPDVMFLNGEPKKDVSGAGAASQILEAEDLSVVNAVKDGRVYGIPKSPFSWLDRPKAPNRIIGLVWAGAMMYPEQYSDVDITKEIQTFYDLFYHMQLTDEQVNTLLNS